MQPATHTFRILACLSLLLTGCSSHKSSRGEQRVNCDTPAISDLRTADSLTLYSLLPLETWNLDNDPKRTAARFKRLPTFHDFPVLGSFTVSPGKETRVWQNLLVERPRFLCDFMPRHGVRAVKDGRHTDFLMCFSCGDLLVYRHGGPETDHRPVWSAEVKVRLNREFDQRHLERDKP
ncbi:hypothetical protein [Prosthecobacter sp.]|uniref:hypothetical protein n=1 Tax=Prosthecobacter sp. TaxID=1965333 RepID=UPI0037846349